MAAVAWRGTGRLVEQRQDEAGMDFKYEAMNFPVPPEIVGPELQRIEQEHGGFITPAAVVDAARPEAAPLHPVFTWDDAEAAERYRREEARHLIRSVRIIRDDAADSPAVRYVNVIVNQESGYVSTFRAMSDEEMRRQVLSDAVAYLRGAQKRYAHLNELAGVVKAMARELDRAERKLGIQKPPKAGAA